jgi:hypothetical protein
MPITAEVASLEVVRGTLPVPSEILHLATVVFPLFTQARHFALDFIGRMKGLSSLTALRRRRRTT